MTQHLIKNYDQVKAHLTRLSKDFNPTAKDYYFAVGDLFNENIPPAPGTAQYSGEANGMHMASYQRMLSTEIQRLLTETDADISMRRLHTIRTTARAWDKKHRHHQCSFRTYTILNSHPERYALIADRMTSNQAMRLNDYSDQAEQIQEALGNSRALRAAVTTDGLPASGRRPFTPPTEIAKIFNRTQTLRAAANTIKGVLNRVREDNDATPLTDEEVAIIGEAYAHLDALSERYGVNFYDEVAA